MKNILKKVGKVLLFLLFFVVLAVPAVYTNSLFGYLPLLTATFLVLMAWIYLLFMKKALSVSSEQGNGQATRGQTLTVSLKVANKSILVCPKATAEIFIADYLGKDDSTINAIFTLDAKSETDFSFDVTMEHVGMYTSGIRNMKIYDFLGIFSVTVPFESEFSVTVLPQIHEYDVTLSDDLLTDSPDASSFSENDGFDYTGVREYVPGDSMKKIHWKLSAHSMGYMTKINEVGLRSDMAVIIDTVSDEKDSNQLLYLNDGIIETAVSLINQAEKMDIDRSILYVDKENHLDAMLPKTDYDYAELVRNISPIGPSKADNKFDAEEIAREEMQAQNRCANLCVCTSRPTEELLMTLINIKNQQRNPILYYVISQNSNESDRKSAASKVRSLDEFGIHYEIITVKV